MLKTPLGEIQIFIDSNAVDYNFQKLNNSTECQNIDGRYKIEVNYTPDGNQHKIICCIKDYNSSYMDGIESGERLELKSFYRNNTKLSIGMEGDRGCCTNKHQVFNEYGYDYDNEYLNNGVCYLIYEKTKTDKYIFGIAWINNYTDENEVQTWFGADPTLMNINYA